jgi:hypothetical protein
MYRSKLTEKQLRELRAVRDVPAPAHRTEFASCERSADFGI